MIPIALGFLTFLAFMLIMAAIRSDWRGSLFAWSMTVYFAGMTIATLQLGIEAPDLDVHHIAVYRWMQASVGFILVCSVIYGIFCVRYARSVRREHQQQQQEGKDWFW